jgi:sugar phosphate isomerase/epimerase
MKKFVLSPSARIVVGSPGPDVHGVACRALVAHLVGYGVASLSARDVQPLQRPRYQHAVPRERFWAIAYRLSRPFAAACVSGETDLAVAVHHHVVGCLLRTATPSVDDDDAIVDHTCVWALDVVHALWPYVEPLAERLVRQTRPAEGSDATRLLRGGEVLAWPARVLGTLWPTDGSEPWPCESRVLGR